jgi:hypothetical protein
MFFMVRVLLLMRVVFSAQAATRRPRDGGFPPLY